MTARTRRLRDARRYALIGVFVVGAALVAALGIATFYGGGFSQGQTRALMVFRGTVTGLDVGTPVQFRGIKIGEVRNIRTLYDPRSRQVQFAVLAEFTGTIEVQGEAGQRAFGAEGGAWIKDMIDRGLRARLQTLSFVTGQQMIMLDFLPDEPPTFTQLEEATIEIPTARSANEEIAETLREVPVREVIADAQRVMAGIDRLLNDRPGRPAELPALLAQLTKLAADLDRTAPRLADELAATTREARGAIAGLSAAASTVGRQADTTGTAVTAAAQDVQRLASRLDRTLAATDELMQRLQTTATRADQAIARLDHALSEDSPVGANLATTLAETTAAARSLRGAVEGLYRKPDALIFGRQQP